MKRKNNLRISELPVVEKTELVELTESEMKSVMGGRWVYTIHLCVRDITCREKIWID
jgi:hypothetical protein